MTTCWRLLTLPMLMKQLICANYGIHRLILCVERADFSFFVLHLCSHLGNDYNAAHKKVRYICT